MLGVYLEVYSVFGYEPKQTEWGPRSRGPQTATSLKLSFDGISIASIEITLFCIASEYFTNVGGLYVIFCETRLLFSAGVTTVGGSVPLVIGGVTEDIAVELCTSWLLKIISCILTDATVMSRASYRRRKSVSVNMPVAFTIYRPHRPVNYTEYTGYAGNIHRVQRVHRVHRVHRSGRIYSRIRNRNVDRRTQINLGLQYLF